MTEISPDSLTKSVKEAKNLYQTKKYQQAAEEFSRAAVVYIKQGNDPLAAEMRNNQCVSLLQANQPEAALVAVTGTSEIFGLSGNKLKMAMALANQATALKELGRNETAIEKYSSAADIFREIGETELLLQTSQSLSSLKLKNRNIPGALFSMQDGLESLEKPNLRQKFLLNLLKIPNKFLDG